MSVHRVAKFDMNINVRDRKTKLHSFILEKNIHIDNMPFWSHESGEISSNASIRRAAITITIIISH